MNPELKANLDEYLKEKMAPLNKQMIEQEKARHSQYLEKHFEKYDELANKHDTYINQLITLEGAILGGVVVFTSPEQNTIWMMFSVCLILISIIFGIIRQNMAITSGYQSHEWNYANELKNHWWTRELWKDDSVKMEKDLMSKHVDGMETSYKKKFSYKILKFFRLNADRIEFIFVTTFIISLILLIVHLFTSTSFTKEELSHRHKQAPVHQRYQAN